MGYHCYIWMPLFYGWFVFQHLDDMDGIPSKKTTFLAHGDLMRGRLPQSTQGADGLGRSCEFLEVS